METMKVTNKWWRVVDVEKSVWLKLIAKKEASPFITEERYDKLTKAAIIELLKKWWIEFDELDNKDKLYNLLINYK